MKLIQVIEEKPAARAKAVRTKNTRSDKIDRWNATILWRKSFMIQHKFRHIKMFLDDDDLESKFLYVRSYAEANAQTLELKKHGYCSGLIHGVEAILKILNGAEEALLYFEKKTTLNNEPLFVFRIERKPIDKH
jgi:hypothetical protein